MTDHSSQVFCESFNAVCTGVFDNLSLLTLILYPGRCVIKHGLQTKDQKVKLNDRYIVAIRSRSEKVVTGRRTCHFIRDNGMYPISNTLLETR